MPKILSDLPELVASDDLVALGKRARACEHFKWLGGELQLLRRDTGEWSAFRRVAPSPSVGTVPDYRDAASVGCLQALVRKAWACCIDVEEFYTNTGSHQFLVRACGDLGDAEFIRGSLHHALIAALEGAPGEGLK